jgi:hypothetical protein
LHLDQKGLFDRASTGKRDLPTGHATNSNGATQWHAIRRFQHCHVCVKTVVKLVMMFERAIPLVRKNAAAAIAVILTNGVLFGIIERAPSFG